MRHTILAIAFCAVAAVPASARQLKLEFNEGRVTVDATSVPARTILTEWARLGGTKILGAERIAGAPLTIKLIDVAESQALEIILRSAAGYMAAPRAAATPGASMYDRIMVMATSTPPASAPTSTRPGANNPVNAPGTQRFVPPRQIQAEEPDESDDDPNPPSSPVFTFPQPGQQPGMVQPGTQMNIPSQFGPPANGGAAPPTIVINPSTPPAPSGGVTAPPGSRVPGMITQPTPIPGQQPAYPPGVRPPGQ